MRKPFLLVALPFVLLLNGCDIEIDGLGNHQFQQDFRFTYPLQSGSTLSLETLNGSVEIAGWDRNEVEITGIKFARTELLRDEVKIDIRHTAASVNIRTIPPTAMNSNAGAQYILRVPRDITLERVVTSNAKLNISDIKGAAKLKTSNGPLQLSKVNGNVEAQTSNGSIEADDVNGSAHLHTSNSHVAANRVHGPVDATSSNGSITVEMEANAGDLIARTSNSSITVRVPAAMRARLRASTSNGNIESAFDGDYERREKHHIEASINGGSGESPLVDLNTSNGNIKIEKQ